MEVLSVSPELAAQWLTLNTNNRPLSKNAVQQLAAQIQRGEWQLTHQGIAFDEDDVLIDGQHRLAAVVKASRAVPMTVTHGVPRTAFTVMDTGRKRTGRDALALVGEANATRGRRADGRVSRPPTPQRPCAHEPSRSSTSIHYRVNCSPGEGT